MNCPKCKTLSGPAASFCMNCGFNLVSYGERKKKENDARVGMRAESMAGLDKVKAGKTKWCFIFVGVGGTLAVICGSLANSTTALIVLGVTGLACYLAMRFDSDDYYSVPHSRDAQGNHRCIYCGARGVYKQGEYKTQKTHASCTKCETHLYTD